MVTNRCLLALLAWPLRRWLIAALAGFITFLVIALPADIIPNPVFGRDVPVTSWALSVTIATSVLSGLLFATYVKTPEFQTPEKPNKLGSAGGLLTFFAVGCPVCNKVALLALGYSGALNYFAPLQPYMAAVGIALLFYALTKRLRNENMCAVNF